MKREKLFHASKLGVLCLQTTRVMFANDTAVVWFFALQRQVNAAKFAHNFAMILPSKTAKIAHFIDNFGILGLACWQ